MSAPVPAALRQAAAHFRDASAAVEVLALTGDHDLFSTLRASLEGRRVWHAPGFQEAAELIMTGRVGVAVLDAQTCGRETAALCDQLRAQFPDLVLVAAGSVDDQTPLVRQITSGDIYRFMHKPVSEARARQFVEASIRRHLDGTTVAAAHTRTRSNTQRKFGMSKIVAIAVATAALIVAIVAIKSGEQTQPVRSATAPRATSATSTAAQATPPVPAMEDSSPIPPASANASSSAASVATSPEAEGISNASEPAKAETATSEARPEPMADSVDRVAAGNAASLVEATQNSASALAAELVKETIAVEQPVAVDAATAIASPDQQTTPPATTDATAAAESIAIPQTPSTAEQKPSTPQLSPREAFLANVVSAVSLPRLKQVNPAYPENARRLGKQGWVDAEFTVAVDGKVKDIDVRGAEPAGLFDKAAADALAQWKFVPVLREGNPIEQRARLRLRFAIEK